MIAALLLAAATAPGCDAVQVPREVAESAFIVMGEMHGTAESPVFTGRVLCTLAQEKPVTLALELTADLQGDLDDYMVSDGGVDARAALVRRGFWKPRLDQYDGRSSTALLDLIERARVLARSGKSVRVVAIDMGSEVLKGPALAEKFKQRDAIMARQAQDALPKGGSVIVHVGNMHAVRHPEEMPRKMPYVALATQLPADRTIALRLEYRGGEYWGCGPTCAKRPMFAAYDDAALDGRIVMRKAGGYDGIAYVGPVSVAMPPEL